MKKVIVIGCPGSGKSTFSQALHKFTDIPLFHLDMLNWNADKTTVPREIFLKRLEEILVKEKWIIDGNYGSTMEKRMSACDTIFFLDYPLDVCLEGVRERKGKLRTDMPWIETEDDEEFLEFIRNYNAESRPKVIELLNTYSQKNVIIFKSRNDADAFLENVDLYL